MSITLNAEDSKEFIRRLYFPTKEEAEEHARILKRIEDSMIIIPTENGFDAIINDPKFDALIDEITKKNG